MLTTILISLGLAMDSFAASISGGSVAKKVVLINALKVGLFFGGFQALMPLIGYLIGIRFEIFISNIDHWIAFLILGFIGGKMFLDSFKKEAKEIDLFQTKTLFILAIATSIDALIAGIAFITLEIDILIAAISIGLVTFVLSFFGTYMGKKLGDLIRNGASATGGMILMGIGVKILYSHLFI